MAPAVVNTGEPRTEIADAHPADLGEARAGGLEHRLLNRPQAGRRHRTASDGSALRAVGDQRDGSGARAADRFKIDADGQAAGSYRAGGKAAGMCKADGGPARKA